MAHPKETLWERDQHTAAKHDLLRGYLAAWFPILVRGGFPGLTYAEGFAGPGEYVDGEPGSPIIALQMVRDRPELLEQGRQIRFGFVEAREDRWQHLRDRVRAEWPRNQRPPTVVIDGERGLCHESLLSVLDRLGAWGQPIFANLDAWGVDVPLWLVARIARNVSSEVLVTFTSDWFMRFATGEHSGADEMFGGSRWRAVAEVATERKRRFLVDAYRVALHSVGLRYTLAFEMVDEGGHELFIIFGSTSPKGLEKMKDAMWKVDRVYGVRFRDPKDPKHEQLGFFPDEPDMAPLRRMVLEELADGRWQSVEDLRAFTLFETAYRRPHATAVLRRLLKKGELERDPDAGQLSGTVQVRSR